VLYDQNGGVVGSDPAGIPDPPLDAALPACKLALPVPGYSCAIFPMSPREFDFHCLAAREGKAESGMSLLYLRGTIGSQCRELMEIESHVCDPKLISIGIRLGKLENSSASNDK